MTHYQVMRNNLKNSDWEITKDKCDSTRAHGRHLAANRKPENKQKISCTNVHLRITEILITLMDKLSAVTLMRLHEMDLSVGTIMEEVPSPAEFPWAAGISEFVA